jgi:hypothetical protein
LIAFTAIYSGIFPLTTRVRITDVVGKRDGEGRKQSRNRGVPNRSQVADLYMASPRVASWNRLINWLEEIDTLRRVAAGPHLE